jgi:hypothetical protein
MIPPVFPHHCQPRTRWGRFLVEGQRAYCGEHGKTYEVQRQTRLVDEGHGRYSRRSVLVWVELL